jgi:hypothetical protein
MDDIHTNPIFGEEHHNQARSFRALADNNRPIRFGVTDIKPRQKQRSYFEALTCCRQANSVWKRITEIPSNSDR